MRKTPVYSIVLFMAIFWTVSNIWLSAMGEGVNKNLALKNTHEIVYPVQYSDQHITQNAIISDPQLKNVAIFDKRSLVANVIDSVQKSTFTPKEGQPEKGTWLWTPIMDITPSYRERILSGIKENGIKNIYLSIDSYLDIYVMPEGKEKNDKQKVFDGIIKEFIASANNNGLTVDAEAGWRNWAEPDQKYKAFAVLKYVMDYNKTHIEKFRGFQYDVEPYLLPRYQDSKKSVLRNFVSLINETVNNMEGSDLELSVTIPEFYDGTNNETPRFFYGLSYGYTIDHLLSVLERRAGSKIIIMAYRNFAEGTNGAIDISKNEIDRANKYGTKIVVAEETGDVPPPYVTFHNTFHFYYEKQLEIIDKTLSSQKSYGGTATHYINALMALK